MVNVEVGLILVVNSINQLKLRHQKYENMWMVFVMV